MNTGVYLAFIALLATIVFFKNGFNQSTFIGILVFAVLASIPWYFGTRNRELPPNRTERLAAGMWVLIRRIVAIALGIPLLLAAYDLGKSANGFAGVGMSLVIGALGFFMFYFALVGAGPKQFEWRDDVELHRDNKNRYKWWL